MPTRTCVACRKKAPQEDLLRFVFSPEGQGFEGTNEASAEESQNLRLDVLRRLSGRGVYCHGKIECLSQQIVPALLFQSLRRKSGGRKTRLSRTSIRNRTSTAQVGEILGEAVRCLEEEEERQRRRGGVRKSVTKGLNELRSLVKGLREHAEEGVSGGRRMRIRL